MSNDPPTTNDLPKPHDGMTPQEKGELLLQYVKAGRHVAGLDFSDVAAMGLVFESPSDGVMAPLDEAQLNRGSFCGAEFISCNLIKAVLDGADLRAVTIDGIAVHSRLHGTNLVGAELKGVFENSSFSNADLSHALLRGNFAKANFEKATLSWAQLEGVDLKGAVLRYAEATYANFCNAKLAGSDFSGADLTRVDFTSATMNGAVLSGAKLSGASLRGAFLVDTDLSGCDLSEVDWLGATLDARTYATTGWTLVVLSRLVREGLGVHRLEQFAPEAQRAILGVIEGLTLTFKTHLNRIDRYIIDGVIVSVLGRDTSCEIAEFVVQEGTGETRVRLTADSPDQLLAVALVLTDIVPDLDVEQQQAVKVWGQRFVAEDLRGQWRTTAETLTNIELRIEPRELEVLVEQDPGYAVFTGFTRFEPVAWREQAAEMIMPVWNSLLTASKHGWVYAGLKRLVDPAIRYALDEKPDEEGDT